MPNNFFSVDSAFPAMEGKPQSEINAEMRNYLFMLLEQLRYTLGNLGAANFNETELERISETISSPIYARLENAEGSLTELTVTAEGLSSRVSDAEGNISTLAQTANGISARVGQTEVAINNLGIQMAGRVTFADLAGNGTTVINGANIKTGTISAVNIDGCTIRSDNLEGKVMLFANGSITIYNGLDMIGGIYPDTQNRLVIHGYGTYMRNIVSFEYTPNVGGYDLLHAGNMLTYITLNAATVRSALGL